VQALNWRKSCCPRHGDIMPSLTIRTSRPIATTAGRFWRAPNDAPSRDSHDQRVIEASLKISPEPRACVSFRTHSAIMWDRAVFGSFKRAALREHRAPRAFALGRRRLNLEDAARHFRSSIAPKRCRTSPLHRTPSTDPCNEIGAGSSIPSLQ